MAEDGAFVTMKDTGSISRRTPANFLNGGVTVALGESSHCCMSTRSRCLFALFALLAVCNPAAAQRLSPLAPAPDWERLEAYQETMTRGEFQRLLDTVFAPGGAAAGVIEIREADAVIFKRLSPPETFALRFAKDTAAAKAPPRYWRPATQLGPATPERPLAGVRVALDPGHIGGEWAMMEERSFFRAGEKPVQEGDMTLAVAKLVAGQLSALGAEVSLVRDAAAPASPFGVEELRPAARKELELQGVPDIRENYDGRRDPLKAISVQWHAEKLFYRVAEIRERARKVNDKIRPDLVVCIHFNADDWSDPENPVFTDRNDLHVIVNGCYSAGELRHDDERFEMVAKILGRIHGEELAVAAAMAKALAAATGLPPFNYTTGNAVKAGTNEYLWARNLLANRLFDCPVVYLEPYRMNHAGAYARIQAGDFEGEREVAGKMCRSIFREYADAVVAGLRAYYTAARQSAGSVPK
jgi:N-acetylmuramoyl-L-alanine amidase